MLASVFFDVNKRSKTLLDAELSLKLNHNRLAVQMCSVYNATAKRAIAAQRREAYILLPPRDTLTFKLTLALLAAAIPIKTGNFTFLNLVFLPPAVQ
jgi:hypothetical protein